LRAHKFIAVKFLRSASLDRITDINKNLGATFEFVIATDLYLLSLVPDAFIAEIIKKYRALPEVVFAHEIAPRYLAHATQGGR